MGLHPVLSRVFGELPGFSAKANVKLEGEGASDDMMLPMQFEYLGGRMRAEINMADVKGSEVPAEMLFTLKQIGMDRVVTIMSGDGKPVIILYPNLNASIEVKGAESAVSKTEGEALTETKLGEETVAGHVCDKYRFVHQGEEALVWRARDLESFPIQVRMDQKSVRMTVHYEDINLEAPKAERFKVPAVYTKHESMEAVMQGAMQRLLKKPAP